MPDYKPVKIVLRWRTMAHIDPKTGQAARSVYPDFRALCATSPAIFNDKQPSQFFDEDCSGPHTSNYGLGSGAAYGEAIILVPQPNADQLITATGYEGCEEVTGTTETELETFWNSKCYDDQANIIEDERLLQAIAAKKTIGIPMTPDDYAALDPDDPAPGRKKNILRTWARYKAAKGVTIV